MTRTTLKTVNNSSTNQDLSNTFYKVSGGYTWEMHNDLVHDTGTVKKTLQASIEEFAKLMTNCMLLNSTAKQDYYASLGVTFRGDLGSYYFVLDYSDNYEPYISTTYTSLQELLTTLDGVLAEGYLLDGSKCELTPEYVLNNSDLLAVRKYPHLHTTSVVHLTVCEEPLRYLTCKEYTLVPVQEYLDSFYRDEILAKWRSSTDDILGTVKFRHTLPTDEVLELVVNYPSKVWYKLTKDGQDIHPIDMVQAYYSSW